MASVCGGALFPALTGLIAQESSYHTAMALPLGAMVISFLFPVYLNTLCARELDGFRETRIGDVDQDGIIGDIARDQRKGSVSVIEMTAGKMD